MLKKGDQWKTSPSPTGLAGRHVKLNTNFGRTAEQQTS